MAKDKLFLDTDVALNHLADRQPFAEPAHRLLGLAELQVVKVCLSSLSFSHLYYLLRKGRTHSETLTLLAKLQRITKIVVVGEQEIQAALGSGFGDFEDAIQYFAAQTEGGVQVIITRNKTDYAASRLPVMSPEEYLAQRSAK